MSSVDILSRRLGDSSIIEKLRKMVDESKFMKIVDELLTFDKIVKSPYSISFYDTDEVTNTKKPHNSLRLSNHWNQMTRSKIGKGVFTHFRTNINIGENVWALGIYDRSSRRYDIIRIF